MYVQLTRNVSLAESKYVCLSSNEEIFAGGYGLSCADSKTSCHLDACVEILESNLRFKSEDNWMSSRCVACKTSE